MFGGDRPGSTVDCSPCLDLLFGGDRPGSTVDCSPCLDLLFGGDRPGSSVDCSPCLGCLVIKCFSFSARRMSSYQRLDAVIESVQEEQQQLRTGKLVVVFIQVTHCNV